METIIYIIGKMLNPSHIWKLSAAPGTSNSIEFQQCCLEFEEKRYKFIRIHRTNDQTASKSWSLWNWIHRKRTENFHRISTSIKGLTQIANEAIDWTDSSVYAKLFCVPLLRSITFIYKTNSESSAIKDAKERKNTNNKQLFANIRRQVKSWTSISMAAASCAATLWSSSSSTLRKCTNFFSQFDSKNMLNKHIQLVYLCRSQITVSC